MPAQAAVGSPAAGDASRSDASRVIVASAATTTAAVTTTAAAAATAASAATAVALAASRGGQRGAQGPVWGGRVRCWRAAVRPRPLAQEGWWLGAKERLSTTGGGGGGRNSPAAPTPRQQTRRRWGWRRWRRRRRRRGRREGRRGGGGGGGGASPSSMSRLRCVDMAPPSREGALPWRQTRGAGEGGRVTTMGGSPAARPRHAASTGEKKKKRKTAPRRSGTLPHWRTRMVQGGK